MGENRSIVTELSVVLVLGANMNNTFHFTLYAQIASAALTRESSSV